METEAFLILDQKDPPIRERCRICLCSTNRASDYSMANERGYCERFARLLPERGCPRRSGVTRHRGIGPPGERRNLAIEQCRRPDLWKEGGHQGKTMNLLGSKSVSREAGRMLSEWLSGRE